MEDYNLTKNFDRIVQVWIPNAPKNKVSGTLHYEEGKIRLELQTSFSAFEGELTESNLIKHYPVLHGVTEKAEVFTALSAYTGKMFINFKIGLISQPETLLPWAVIFGDQVAETFEIEWVKYRIPGLEVWNSETPSELRFHRSADGLETEALEYQIQIPPDTNTFVNCINASLIWQTICKPKVRTYKDAKIEVSSFIKFVPEVSKQLPWFLEMFSRLRSFLVISSGSDFSSDLISFKINNSEAISFLIPSFLNSKLCKITEASKFFLTKTHLSDNFDKVINNWFDNFETFAEPCRLSISLFCSRRELWTHIALLTAFHALEGLHRVRHDGNYVDLENYEIYLAEMIKSIPAAIMGGHRTALVNRLKYGNEKSLNSRMNQIVREIPESIVQPILGSKKMPRKWIDTRNYYTHWDESLMGDILKRQEFYDVTIRLEMMLRIYFLLIVGVPEVKILESLNNASELSQSIQHANSRATIKKNSEATEASYGRISFIKSDENNSAED